ncbi:unnamed protein product [Colias eurytheme]|nr:unnamed protein product [Colias eurytheme]
MVRLGKAFKTNLMLDMRHIQIDQNIKGQMRSNEGLKRTVRKKTATCQLELYRTGGGKKTAPPFDNVEEQIKAMIDDNVKHRWLGQYLRLRYIATNSRRIDVTKIEEFLRIPPSQMATTEFVESEATQNQVVLFVTDEFEPLPLTTSAEQFQKEQI